MRDLEWKLGGKQPRDDVAMAVLVIRLEAEQAGALSGGDDALEIRERSLRVGGLHVLEKDPAHRRVSSGARRGAAIGRR